MTEVNRYALSDADMLEITSAIDNANDSTTILYKAIYGVWNAILGQEGTTFHEELHKAAESGVKFQPTAYAIPSDQSEEIIERMRKRMFNLGISPMDITNYLLDWVNIAPSTY